MTGYLPVPGLDDIGTGQTETGARWTLRAGGNPRDCYMLIEITHPDGRQEGGGLGGPALPAGRRVNAYTGQSDEGPMRFLARAQPDVERLRLEVAGRPALELGPVGSSAALHLRFFVALLPHDAQIRSAVALDSEGHELERASIPRAVPPRPRDAGA